MANFRFVLRYLLKQLQWGLTTGLVHPEDEHRELDVLKNKVG
jgi:hypothetical protein